MSRPPAEMTTRIMMAMLTVMRMVMMKRMMMMMTGRGSLKEGSFMGSYWSTLEGVSSQGPTRGSFKGVL